jgi:hypothetical protein
MGLDENEKQDGGRATFSTGLRRVATINRACGTLMEYHQ